MEQFNSLPTTKIGDIAEAYAQEYLNKLGYKLYWNSSNTNHTHDGYGYSGASITTAVRNLFEVKAKYPTPGGEMSIHENDLIKYEQLQQVENKTMVVMYVNHRDAELYVTTPALIRKHTTRLVYDEKEKKTLVYFNNNAWKKKADIPKEVTDRMWQISQGIQFNYKESK